MKARTRLRIDSLTPPSAREVGVVVGFFVSIAASLALGAFSESDIALGAFGVTLVLFAVYLHRSHALTERLALVLTERASGEVPPQEYLTNDLERGLVECGFIRTFSGRERFRLLSPRFSYVRGQNFMNLISDGFIEAKRYLQILADHRFEPFAIAVNSALRPGVTIACINAEPDEMYDASSLDDRLAWAAQPNVRYLLTPASEIPFAVLVFDGATALVCTKPPGRAVCNFAESLFTDDPQLVAYLQDAFEYVWAASERTQARRGLSTKALLEQRKRLITSARATT